MTLHVLPDLEQGTDAWHDQRRGLVTASVVGRLLTPTLKVADNDTSRGLVGTLVAERITGYTEPSYANDDMMRGVLHEPVARQRYAEVNHVEVQQVGFMVRDDWGFQIGASPDGLVGTRGGLEIKCPRAKSHIRTIVSGEIPSQYMAQIQTCLLVSGRQWWEYVSFCSGLPMWTKRVLPDPEWHEAIVAAVDAFEKSAEALVGEYRAKSTGLPATERIPNDFELVI